MDVSSASRFLGCFILHLQSPPSPGNVGYTKAPKPGWAKEQTQNVAAHDGTRLRTVSPPGSTALGAASGCSPPLFNALMPSSGPSQESMSEPQAPGLPCPDSPGNWRFWLTGMSSLPHCFCFTAAAPVANLHVRSHLPSYISQCYASAWHLPPIHPGGPTSSPGVCPTRDTTDLPTARHTMNVILSLRCVLIFLGLLQNNRRFTSPTVSSVFPDLQALPRTMDVCAVTQAEEWVSRD